METVCPYCDHFIKVIDELKGTRTLCEFCEQIFTVDPVVVLDLDATREPTAARRHHD